MPCRPDNPLNGQYGEEDEYWDIIPDSAPVKFDSAEHADIPAECNLRFSADADAKVLSGKSEEGTLFQHPKSKMNFTYAKTIALGGDFFTVYPVWRTICYGETPADRKMRFTEAVNNLKADGGYVFAEDGTLTTSLDNYLSSEVGGIEAILADTPAEKDITTGPLKPEDKGTHLITQAYVNETNGVMPITNQFKMVGLAHYGNILLYNMDHFGEMAWDCYIAGHSLALQIAKEGKGNVEKLKDAYLYDAFAMHYLSDQFSSGHIRTPRMEMNRPSWLQKILKGLSKLPKWIAANGGGWDGMTGFMHELDNATGLLVSNLRGDRWIAYGDNQFFIESNRINRLKSIECVQSSIDEVYDTWIKGQYPEYTRKPGSQDLMENCKSFAALQIVTIPVTHGMDQNLESNGNPINSWITYRDESQPTPKQISLLAEKSEEDKATTDKFSQAEKNKNNISKDEAPPEATGVVAQGIATPDKRVQGSLVTSENGYWFARRKNEEDCCDSDYVWGSPGIDWNLRASWDVRVIEQSNFYKLDRFPKDARAVEILSGGFIQVQEYRADDGKVNYGVNVWGPVQTPVNYTTNKELAARGGLAKSEADKKAPTNRQFTFTFRGRTDVLSGSPESVANNKTFRWHSWCDRATGKTSLLKFSWCANDADASKANSILVESWSFTDPDPKRDQQWTHYEKILELRRPLEFGGPKQDRKDPAPNDFGRTVLVSSFKQAEWDRLLSVTRFFIFPFRQGSSPTNPDLVTFSWSLSDSALPKPVVNLASTDNQLLNPKPRMTSFPQTLEAFGNTSIFNGFTKQFEDVNNKGMVLHVRANRNDKEAAPGIMIHPVIFEQDGTKDAIITKASKFKMAVDKPSATDDFYQVLTGDTR
ncbi:MAG: hypothetical protein Q9166_002095 [cf. Caloplaca sp. 2 TL-2023]